jgi:preprotein translocase subunit SecE
MSGSATQASLRRHPFIGVNALDFPRRKPYCLDTRRAGYADRTLDPRDLTASGRSFARATRPGAFWYEEVGMAKTNPFEFLQQVRSEGSKVTWPTRKETMVTTAMVLVMVLLAAIFFLIVDQILRWGVGLVLGMGG